MLSPHPHKTITNRVCPAKAGLTPSDDLTIGDLRREPLEYPGGERELSHQIGEREAERNTQKDRQSVLE
jgi:hypothetical protein